MCWYQEDGDAEEDVGVLVATWLLALRFRPSAKFNLPFFHQWLTRRLLMIVGSVLQDGTDDFFKLSVSD